MTQQKHSLDFGKKEKVLNYACQTYPIFGLFKIANKEIIPEIQKEITRLSKRINL